MHQKSLRAGPETLGLKRDLPAFRRRKKSPGFFQTYSPFFWPLPCEPCDDGVLSLGRGKKGRKLKQS